MDKFEKAMGFNTGAHNPKYLNDKLLIDAIVKEQESRVKRVQGNKIEIEDPAKPGVTTTVDTDQVDIDTDEQGNIEVKDKTNKTGMKRQLRPGASVKFSNENK